METEMGGVYPMDTGDIRCSNDSRLNDITTRGNNNCGVQHTKP